VTAAALSSQCSVAGEEAVARRMSERLPGTASQGPDTGAAADVARFWDALREVLDPEIPISLVDLGLIYYIRYDAGTVEVDFTYTAIACPCAHFIQWDIAERLQKEPGVEDVRLNEVWNPGWTKARVTPEGRTRLKELGVSL
jgi:metal-sulfur cluster biosynthetic enzyme